MAFARGLAVHFDTVAAAAPHPQSQERGGRTRFSMPPVGQPSALSVAAASFVPSLALQSRTAAGTGAGTEPMVPASVLFPAPSSHVSTLAAPSERLTPQPPSEAVNSTQPPSTCGSGVARPLVDAMGLTSTLPYEAADDDVWGVGISAAGHPSNTSGDACDATAAPHACSSSVDAPTIAATPSSKGGDDGDRGVEALTAAFSPALRISELGGSSVNTFTFSESSGTASSSTASALRLGADFGGPSSGRISSDGGPSSGRISSDGHSTPPRVAPAPAAYCNYRNAGNGPFGPHFDAFLEDHGLLSWQHSPHHSAPPLTTMYHVPATRGSPLHSGGSSSSAGLHSEGVAAPPINRASLGDAHILVLAQLFDDAGRIKFDIPGGGRQAGETSLECAGREAVEEVRGLIPLGALKRGEGVEEVRLNPCIACDGLR